MKTNLLKYSYHFNSLVIQPTTSCNLNCKYCYLPNRNIKNIITQQVLEKVKEYVIFKDADVSLIWHGGEPLTLGVKKFNNILDNFVGLKVKHAIQTNATLINREWCELIKQFNINIGVSIDGNSEQNLDRVNWTNKESYNSTLKGINQLLTYDIPFHVICLVNENNINEPDILFDFFSNLGCYSVGFNIEEQENVNTRKSNFTKTQIENFWKIIFEKWRQNPNIRIREIDQTLSWLTYFTNKNSLESVHYIDLLPSIAFNGDVVLLSPEFQGAKSESYDNFIVGNILDTDLSVLENQFPKAKYVKDFEMGISNCKSECEYFNFCGGGNASNKYFENSNLQSTETNYCLYSRKILINSLLKQL